MNTKTVYWARIYRMDWWGYFDDSPDFDTYEQAKAWVLENAHHYEDWFITQREVAE